MLGFSVGYMRDISFTVYSTVVRGARPALFLAPVIEVNVLLYCTRYCCRAVDMARLDFVLRMKTEQCLNRWL